MPAGRPRKDIDWDFVDELLEAGCLATEIAGRLGIERTTLYKRCEEDKNMQYSTYSQQKKSSGESLLREKQFKAAISGDRSMLIWLGKQRLKQSDKHEVKTGKDLSDLDSWIKDQEQTPPPNCS